MKKIFSILSLSLLMLSTGVVFSQNTIETHEITASVAGISCVPFNNCPYVAQSISI